MVDAVVGPLLDKLLTLLVREGQQLLQFDSHFDKLKDELRYMQCYIKEADRTRRKEGRYTQDILKLVTSDLRELVYDAEDVIADCNIEFLKQHNGHLLNIVSHCFPRHLKSRLKISKCLKEINERTEAVKKNMGLYLPAAPSTITSREIERTTWSRNPIFLEEADIVGLEVDASKVEEWISEPQEPSTIIGIVGMGGIGKTTLVGKICNKNSIKDSFQFIISVTASQNCENEDLLKRMLVKMKVDENSLKNAGVGYLLEELTKKLGHQKYLVVVDDVWENKMSWWGSLKAALHRKLVWCVIVTTRNENVARTMGAKHIHRLKILSKDASWSLFSKIAFEWNGGKCPTSDVAGIGEKIVASCKGLPLAIRAVAGMMHGKGDSVSAWKRISDHLKEASAEEKIGELVMSSLELSYEELPTYLKPCLLCFSMLPEDYLMKVDDLVCWWIGEGFVSETNARTALEIGREYAVELCNRSLLLGERDIFDRIFEEIKIHDLVRDIVIKVARDVNFTSLDERGRPELNARSRRLGLGIFDNGPIENVESTKAKKSKIESKLRTLWGLDMKKEVLLNKSLKLRKLKRLKVLSVGFHLENEAEEIIMKDWLYGITSLLNLVSLSLEYCTVEELPDSIGNLHNLQILTLSYFFEVEELPDSIGNLHNLQILTLSYFLKLKMLPSTISKLEKLISFRVYECRSLTCMPEGIGRLSKLERLVWFPYTPYANSSERISSSICELKNLRKLKVLQVELTNQNNLLEQKLNVLSELKHLHYMEISFLTDDFEGGVSVSNLNHLPLEFLEELTLTFYRGESTPVWLNPTSLPNLKFLCIDQGHQIRHMSPKFWEGNWKIEALYLKDLDKLEEEWMMFLRAMPSLRSVRVCRCRGLKSFPLDLTQNYAIWRKEDGNTACGH